MAIPFFSIDLKIKDLINFTKDILIPVNKKQKKILLHKILERRYPNRYLSLLPSARIGFFLSLKFLFEKDDEIIFSSMSFPLYIKIAKQLGLKVRLVDISIDDLNIDHTKIETQINEKTKGIVVTHLFGYPCEIMKIKELCDKKNLILIEDCAQSFNSRYDNIETGNFGDVGIISTSLLKIPTTLSGGFVVTKDEKLSKKINQWTEDNLENGLYLKFKLFIKVLLSILNSYPKIYSVLSDKIFSFLKSYNPRIYRNILYSGMGMKEIAFNPLERPNLSKYQITAGISQLNRCEMMNQIRKEYSLFFQERFKDHKNIKVINNHYKENWNHQYFVILIKNNFDQVFKKLFKAGIHVMDENVWDCTKYNFELENEDTNFPNTKQVDGCLIRIQNNSLLNKKEIELIANKIIDASN